MALLKCKTLSVPSEPAPWTFDSVGVSCFWCFGIRQRLISALKRWLSSRYFHHASSSLRSCGGFGLGTLNPEATSSSAMGLFSTTMFSTA
jgi:hypothetical protein